MLRLTFSLVYDSTAHVTATYDPAKDALVVTSLAGDKVIPELRKRLGTLADDFSDRALCAAVPIVLRPEGTSLRDGQRVRLYAQPSLPDDGSYIWLDTIEGMSVLTT